MYCSHCGQQMEKTDKFCPNCGAPAEQEEQPQTEPVFQTFQANSEPASQPAQPRTEPWGQPAQAKQHPMKWFKFLIYFLTFATALTLLIDGIGLLTGMTYGGDAGVVYAFFPGLFYLDLLIGLVSLAMAAFWIYVRFRLAKFRADGPKLLIMVYVVSIVINLVYGIGATVLLSGSMGLQSSPMTAAVSSSCGAIIMIFANKAYFGKRAELFVN